MWQCIKNNLEQIIKENVPTKMTSTRSSQPWFNTKCKRLTRKKCKLYKKMINNYSVKTEQKFKEIKRETQNECRKANNYLNDLINEDVLKKKKLFSYIKGKAKGFTNSVSELKDHTLMLY